MPPTVPEGPFQCQSQRHPPGAPPLLKVQLPPHGLPKLTRCGPFHVLPSPWVGPLMPISSPSWGLSLAVSSACTLFPAPVHGSCLSSCRISPRGALPGHPLSQSPVLLTLHGSDRGPLPMLLGNPLPACQPPCQLCAWPKAGGLTPGVLVFWPGGQLCSVLGVPDGNREDGRGRRPAQVAGTVSRVEGRTVCCPFPAGGEQSERDSGVPGQIPALWLACCVTLGQSPASSEPSILTMSVYIGDKLCTVPKKH